MDPLLASFAASVGVTVAIAKWVSISRERRSITESRSFLLSPVFVWASFDRRQPTSRPGSRDRAARLAVYAVLLTLTWTTYLSWVPPARPEVGVQGYLALIPIYLLGQTLSLGFELVFGRGGYFYPGHFREPFRSVSLSEFWGQRWATWVSDSFREWLPSHGGMRSVGKLFVAFTLSGIWHELTLNLPLLVVHGTNRMGSMVAYFLIQAAGLAVDHRLKDYPVGRWLLCWTCVIVPAPLIINESVLRICGLYVP